MKIESGQLLYVFHAADDGWLRELRELFMGPMGWDPEDFDSAWITEDDRPSMFAQLMIVYRYTGLTPEQAIETLIKHPDYQYCAEYWEGNRDT